MSAITPPSTWVKCSPVIAKKVRAEHGRAPRVLEKLHSLSDQSDHSRMWSNAKQYATTDGNKGPPDGVDLSPALAARVAINMVRLLLTRMKVISEHIDDAGRELRKALANPGWHSDVAVGKKHGPESDCVGDDEQPHHQLFGWNGKRATLPCVRYAASRWSDSLRSHASGRVVRYSLIHITNSKYSHSIPMKCQ